MARREQVDPVDERRKRAESRMRLERGQRPHKKNQQNGNIKVEEKYRQIGGSRRQQKGKNGRTLSQSAITTLDDLSSDENCSAELMASGFAMMCVMDREKGEETVRGFLLLIRLIFDSLCPYSRKSKRYIEESDAVFYVVFV